ncbi:Hypothetical protein A7982_06868 [Minicystis rosea]|nr:Hypothetical protein A7982_06868 [Minicystis rosea]
MDETGPGERRFLAPWAGTSPAEPRARLSPRVLRGGLEHLVAHGPAVVVVNRDRAAWLADLTAIMQTWSAYVGNDPTRLPSALLPPNLPLDRFADAALAAGRILVAYPEQGRPPLFGRGPKRLRPFQTTFVELATAHDAPVIPIACAGARFRVGAPLRVTLDPARASAADYRSAAEEVRQVMQAMIDGPLKKHPHREQSPVAAPNPVSGTPATIAELEARIRVLEAREQVYRAMVTWGRALDTVERTHDVQDARYMADDLMSPDGIFDLADTGWGVWGPEKDEIVRHIMSFVRRFSWAYHTYPNGEIDVDPARGTARFHTSTELVPLARDGNFQWFFLTQTTTFVRQDGAWRVQRYKLSNLRTITPAPSHAW